MAIKPEDNEKELSVLLKQEIEARVPGAAFDPVIETANKLAEKPSKPEPKQEKPKEEIAAEEEKARQATTELEKKAIEKDLNLEKNESEGGTQHGRIARVQKVSFQPGAGDSNKKKKEEEFRKAVHRAGEQALERLNEIYEELGATRERIDAIESKYLTDEERAYQSGESPEEHKTRIEKLLEEKVRNGEMTQGELDEWRAQKVKEQELIQEAQKIVNRQRRELEALEQESLRINNRTSELQTMGFELERIGAMRNKGEQDAAMIVFLQDHPDFDREAADTDHDGVISVAEAEVVVMRESTQVEEKRVEVEAKQEKVAEAYTESVRVLEEKTGEKPGGEYEGMAGFLSETPMEVPNKTEDMQVEVVNLPKMIFPP